MDERRLIGEDGQVTLATQGTTQTGDGIDDLNDLTGSTAGGWYKIITKATSSALPDALDEGYMFYHPDGTLVPANGDEVALMSFKNVCFMTSWTLDFSKSDIDVSTLCDLVKAWRVGKSEASFSFEGFDIVGGNADKVDVRKTFVSQFMSYVTDDGTGVAATGWDLAEPNDDLLHMWIILNEEQRVSLGTGDQEHSLIIPVRLNAFNRSGGVDAPVVFSGGGRVDGAEKPTEYVRTIA